MEALMENGIPAGNPPEEGQTPGSSINSRLRRLENLIYLLLSIWFISVIMFLSFTGDGKTLAGKVAAGKIRSSANREIAGYPIVNNNSPAQRYMNLGWKCFLEGKDAQAMSCCSMALSEDPDYAPAYALRSCIYEELGHPEKAVKEMDKAISLDPARRDIYIAIRQNIKDRSEQSATL